MFATCDRGYSNTDNNLLHATDTEVTAILMTHDTEVRENRV